MKATALPSRARAAAEVAGAVADGEVVVRQALLSPARRQVARHPPLAAPRQLQPPSHRPMSAAAASRECSSRDVEIRQRRKRAMPAEAVVVVVAGAEAARRPADSKQRFLRSRV